jgi:hypothetical protein
MVSGSILLGIASSVFFFSQRFTFYTPYSTSTDWVLSLPNGVDFPIHSFAGLAFALGCFLLGSIFVLISIMKLIRPEKKTDGPVSRPAGGDSQ